MAPDAKPPAHPYRYQTYAEYAGFFTETMKQLAIEGGCETLGEMEAWFEFNYGTSAPATASAKARPTC
jgi:hypothetical protein